MTHILTRTLLTTAMLMAGNLLLPAAPAYSESAEEARLRDEADNDLGHQKVQELLTQGTNPNVRGFKGRTAVHAAAGGCAKQNLEVLLKHGGDATMRDTDGNTPLHYAAGAIGVELECAPVTRLLVQHDAPLDQANQNGNTALHLAAKGSKEDRLAVLLDAGANPRAINGDRLTPLQLFVKDGTNAGRIVALLLDAGANPNRKTPAGYTPLHVTLKSVGRGKTEVVEALLAGNADPCIRDPEGHIPYQYGKVHENENALVRDLLDRAGGFESACEQQGSRTANRSSQESAAGDLNQEQTTKEARRAEAERQRQAKLKETFGETFEMVKVGDFEIGKYEVTQEVWEAVMGGNPSHFGGCSQCPVEQVSWNDVQAFLKQVNAMTGLEYRLPTEAEWEEAVGGYDYAGSNDPDAVAWYDKNSGERTHPVGQKQPNELGLYDMSGNVAEWMADCWEGDCSKRVVRGGSWNNVPRDLRSASRGRYTAGNRNGSRGVRLARTLTP